MNIYCGKTKIITIAVAVLLVAMSAISGSFVGAGPVAADEEPFMVTFLFADHWNDEGWNMAHKTGVDQLLSLGELIDEDDLSFAIKIDGDQYPELDGRILEVNLVTDVGYGSEIEGIMQKAIETQKPDLLFATWWNSKDAVTELAPRYPDIKFEHCSGYPVIKSSDFSDGNVATYFVKMEDSDYATGYAAGLMGFDKIGLVATYPIPEPVRGVNAFALGLKKGLAEAGNDPDEAEVQVIWIESWLDIQKEQLATETLLGMGYETIRQMPDTPTTSLTACNEGANVLGYGSDVLPKAPCALVSNVWQWGNYYTQRVLDAMRDDWTPQDWFKGWNEDGMGLVWNPEAPPDVRQKTEALVEQMREGTSDPFTGPIEGKGLDEDGEEITIEVPAGYKVGDMGRLTMQWLVTGVISPMPSFPSGGHDLDLIEVE